MVDTWKGGEGWKVDRCGKLKVEGWKGGQTWKVHLKHLKQPESLHLKHLKA